MLSIAFGAPAWSTTFPHRVVPNPEEALVSLLPRCDEENGWTCGTTWAHLRSAGHYPGALPDLIVPSHGLVEALAEILFLPTSTIAATTYLWELMRFFGTATPSPGDLCSSFVFHLCPGCLRQQRMLLRSHLLLGMTTCLHHHLSLLSSCTCGTALEPITPRTSPFTCPTCRQDWGELPCLQASWEDLERERLILACYTWWLRSGDQAYLEDILRCLMHLDVVGSRTSRPERSSRWLRYEARRRSRLNSSSMAPLSAVVSHLDEWDLLSHFSGEA